MFTITTIHLSELGFSNEQDAYYIPNKNGINKPGNFY